LFSSPLTSLDLSNNDDLDDAAKTLVRAACKSKKGFSLEL
jgi:hypothetical protein